MPEAGGGWRSILPGPKFIRELADTHMTIRSASCQPRDHSDAGVAMPGGRYALLAAVVLIQGCLGGIYAWSTFVPALHGTWGLSMAQTQLLFGVLIGVFTLVMVPAGRLVRRLGPRPITIFGGILFGGGFLLAAGSGGRFGLLFVGIVLLAGAGIGCCYVCALTAGAAWFPERKGLVTGFAVAGFGGGAVFLAFLGERLLAWGMDVLRVFGLVGVMYGAVIVGAAMFLSLPTATRTSRAKPVPGRYRDRFFVGLLAGMFAGTFAGLALIGNLKPLALASGLSEGVATGAIAFFSLGNASGRITWGWLADHLDRRSGWFSMAFLAAATALMALLRGHGPGFLVASMLVGFGFGACFVVYAALVASHYGIERLGDIYPLVFLAYGLSGIVGPATAGFLLDLTGGHGASLVLCLAVPLAATFLLRRILVEDRVVARQAKAGHP